MQSQEIVKYLENIRLGRNITQSEFIEDIVSSRQYHRYLNGESQIAFSTLEKFAEKLGLSTRKLITQIEREKHEQNRTISMFYNAVVNQDRATEKSLEKTLNTMNILDNDSRLFYEFAKIISQFYKQALSKSDVTEKIKQLIHYPEILEHEYLTDIEMLVMSSLIDFLPKEKHTPILVRLTVYYENQDRIMSGGNEMIHPIILMRLAKAYGLKNNLDKVLELSDIALERGNLYKQTHLFYIFYYFKALSYFKKNMKAPFEENLYRCYCALEITDNRERFKKYRAIIEKDFDLDFIKFINRYIRKKHSR